MTKEVNYTDEVVEDIVKEYVHANTDEDRKEVVTAMSAKYGKTEPSIRAKLVREGVYVAVSRKSKLTGSKPRTKAELVHELEVLMGKQEGELETLEKASKLVILAILKQVANADIKEDENMEVQAKDVA